MFKEATDDQFFRTDLKLAFKLVTIGSPLVAEVNYREWRPWDSSMSVSKLCLCLKRILDMDASCINNEGSIWRKNSCMFASF